jgi:hypothetical protein
MLIESRLIDDRVSKHATSKSGEETGQKVYEELNERLEQIQPGVLGNI